MYRVLSLIIDKIEAKTKKEAGMTESQIFDRRSLIAPTRYVAALCKIKKILRGFLVFFYLVTLTAARRSISPSYRQSRAQRPGCESIIPALQRAILL